MAVTQVRREGDDILISQGTVAGGEVVISVPAGDVDDLIRALVAASGQRDQVVSELVTAGVDPYVARQLSSSVTLSMVRGWRRYIGQAEGLKRPTAFLVARLQQGEWPPEDDRRRYIDGEYADYIER